MREILFRGKRTDNDEWVAGSPWIFSQPIEKAVIIYGMGLIGEDDDVSRYCESCEVYPSSISQFTGLTDKSGKKLFEGDIIRFSTPYCLYTVPIVYQNGAWFADNKREASFTLYSIMKLSPEIIGNIYDNPELLEVE